MFLYFIIQKILVKVSSSVREKIPVNLRKCTSTTDDGSKSKAFGKVDNKNKAEESEKDVSQEDRKQRKGALSNFRNQVNYDNPVYFVIYPNAKFGDLFLKPTSFSDE